MKATPKKLDKRKRVFVENHAVDICMKSFRDFYEQSECLYAEKDPNPDVNFCRWYNVNGTCWLKDEQPE